MRVTNELDAEIGKRLRQARLTQNLTQSDLAAKLDLSFQQVQKYENGTNRVSASRLWAIARILGLSINYFYNGLEDASNNQAITQIAVGDDVLPDRILRAATTISRIPDGSVLDHYLKLGRSLARNASETKQNETNSGD